MMLREGGYLIGTTDDGPPIERSTLTCGHCNRIVIVKPKCDPADLGGLCKVCMKLICPQCYGLDRCDPFEKKLERAEARDRFRRSLEF